MRDGILMTKSKAVHTHFSRMLIFQNRAVWTIAKYVVQTSIQKFEVVDTTLSLHLRNLLFGGKCDIINIKGIWSYETRSVGENY